MLVVTNSAQISCARANVGLAVSLRPIRSFSNPEPWSGEDTNASLLKYAQSHGTVVGYNIIPNQEHPDLSLAQNQPGLSNGGFLIVTPKRIGIFYTKGATSFKILRSSDMLCDFAEVSPLTYRSTYFARAALEPPTNVVLAPLNGDTLVLQEFQSNKLAGFPEFSKAVLSYGSPLAFYGIRTSELGWQYLPTTQKGGLMCFLNPFFSPSQYATDPEWGVIVGLNVEAKQALEDFRAGRKIGSSWCREYEAAANVLASIEGTLQFATRYSEGLAYNIVDVKLSDGFGIKEWVNGDSSYMYSYMPTSTINAKLQEIEARYRELLTADVNAAYATLKDAVKAFNERIGSVYNDYANVESTYVSKAKEAKKEWTHFPLPSDFGFSANNGFCITGLPKPKLPKATYTRTTTGVASGSGMAKDCSASFNDVIDYMNWDDSPFSPVIDYDSLVADCHERVNKAVQSALNPVVANLKQLGNYATLNGNFSQINMSVREEWRIKCKKKHRVFDSCSETSWVYGEGFSGGKLLDFLTKYRVAWTKSGWAKSSADPNFSIDKFGVGNFVNSRAGFWKCDIRVMLTVNPLAAVSQKLAESDRIEDTKAILTSLLNGWGYSTSRLTFVGSKASVGSSSYRGHKKFYDNCRHVSRDYGDYIVSGPGSYWAFTKRPSLTFEITIPVEFALSDWAPMNTQIKDYEAKVEEVYDKMKEKAASTAISEFISWFQSHNIGEGKFVIESNGCLFKLHDAEAIGFNSVASTASFRSLVTSAIQKLRPDDGVSPVFAVSDQKQGHAEYLAWVDLLNEIDAKYDKGVFWYNPEIGRNYREEPRMLSISWRYC